MWGLGPALRKQIFKKKKKELKRGQGNKPVISQTQRVRSNL
jgi:hypothetical protein